jgi:hypothetical protein
MVSPCTVLLLCTVPVQCLTLGWPDEPGELPSQSQNEVRCWAPKFLPAVPPPRCRRDIQWASLQRNAASQSTRIHMCAEKCVLCLWGELPLVCLSRRRSLRGPDVRNVGPPSAAESGACGRSKPGGGVCVCGERALRCAGMRGSCPGRVRNNVEEAVSVNLVRREPFLVARCNLKRVVICAQRKTGISFFFVVATTAATLSPHHPPKNKYYINTQIL